MRIILIGLVALIAGGCTTTTVSRDELNRLVNRQMTGTVNSVVYMGSSDGYHYLRHEYIPRTRYYRVAENDFEIVDPFPRTRDRNEWRVIKNHWQLWPYGVTIREGDSNINFIFDDADDLDANPGTTSPR